MTLARAWRRQLYGASSAALIVPFALLAALAVLALGGSFHGVGVLGQIFAGPPVPSVAGGGGSAAASGGGAGITVARALPAIPAVALGPVAPGGTGRIRGGRGVHRVVPVVPGPRRGGGALTPVGVAAPIVTGGRPTSAGAGSGSTVSAPAGSGSGSAGSGSGGGPSPQPAPSPKPTVVDQVVKAVTPVTQQLPAPAGPVATQAIQAAGAAADSVLPPGVVQVPAAQGPAALAGLKLP
jgi:hypothetical protein